MLLEINWNALTENFDSASVYIGKVFEFVDGEMDAALGPIIGVATVLAGIGSIVYLAKIFLPMLERGGEGIEVYPLIKPILIAVLITQFGAFTSLLDSTLKQISDGVSSSYVNSAPQVDFKKAKERNLEKMKVEIEKKKAEKRENQSVIARAWGDFKSSFLNAFGFDLDELPDRLMLWLKYDVLFSFLRWLSLLVGSAAYMCIILLSKFYLMFLAILGPLSLALSQFSWFEGSFGNWLGKYISIGLWPALANVLKYMNNEVMSLMTTATGDSFVASLVIFLLIIFTAYFYTQIPEMSEFIVSSGGAGGLNAGLMRGLNATRKVVGTGTAVATGVAAGTLAAKMRGGTANKLEQALYNQLTKRGQGTGIRAKFNRMGQTVGYTTGALGTKLADWGQERIVGDYKGWDKEQRKEYTAQRKASRAEKIDNFQSGRNAPKRKDLRNRARALKREARMGHYLSPDDREFVDRYKRGEYKGRGKYTPSPEAVREQDFKEFRSFVMKGFGRAETQASDQFNDKWRPPMKAKKRNIVDRVLGRNKQ